MSYAWVNKPVKTVPAITYMLFVATLNHIHVVLGRTLASTLQCNLFSVTFYCNDLKNCDFTGTQLHDFEKFCINF